MSLKAGRQKTFRDQRTGADHWSAISRGLRHQVSLVLAGANPGAYIDQKSFAHSDDYDDEDQAVIYVLETKGAKAEKLVVRTEYASKVKAKDGKVDKTANYIRSAGVVALGDLKNKRYKLIEGEL